MISLPRKCTQNFPIIHQVNMSRHPFLYVNWCREHVFLYKKKYARIRARKIEYKIIKYIKNKNGYERQYALAFKYMHIIFELLFEISILLHIINILTWNELGLRFDDIVLKCMLNRFFFIFFFTWKGRASQESSSRFIVWNLKLNRKTNWKLKTKKKELLTI